MREGARSVAGPLFAFDPGWLFLLAGSALIAATVLIPAYDQLAQSRWERDRAIAVERHAAKRLENYSNYLDAVQRRDPTVVMSLAASQLNLGPSDKLALLGPSDFALPSGEIFSALEPEFEDVPPPVRPRSLLQKWTTDRRARVWLLGLGGLSLLIGLLPATRPSERRPE